MTPSVDLASAFSEGFSESLSGGNASVEPSASRCARDHRTIALAEPSTNMLLWIYELLSESSLHSVRNELGRHLEPIHNDPGRLIDCHHRQRLKEAATCLAIVVDSTSPDHVYPLDTHLQHGMQLLVEEASSAAFVLDHRSIIFELHLGLIIHSVARGSQVDKSHIHTLCNLLFEQANAHILQYACEPAVCVAQLQAVEEVCQRLFVQSNKRGGAKQHSSNPAWPLVNKYSRDKLALQTLLDHTFRSLSVRLCPLPSHLNALEEAWNPPRRFRPKQLIDAKEDLEEWISRNSSQPSQDFVENNHSAHFATAPAKPSFESEASKSSSTNTSTNALIKRTEKLKNNGSDPLQNSLRNAQNVLKSLQPSDGLDDNEIAITSKVQLKQGIQRSERITGRGSKKRHSERTVLGFGDEAKANDLVVPQTSTYQPKRGRKSAWLEYTQNFRSETRQTSEERTTQGLKPTSVSRNKLEKQNQSNNVASGGSKKKSQAEVAISGGEENQAGDECLGLDENDKKTQQEEMDPNEDSNKVFRVDLAAGEIDFPEKTNTGNRKHRKWTSEEEQHLRQGMTEFGEEHNKWKKILEKHFAWLSHRTPVDLKDKWRTINKRLN